MTTENAANNDMIVYEPATEAETERPMTIEDMFDRITMLSPRKSNAAEFIGQMLTLKRVIVAPQVEIDDGVVVSPSAWIVEESDQPIFMYNLEAWSKADALVKFARSAHNDLGWQAFADGAVHVTFGKVPTKKDKDHISTFIS